MWRPSNHSSNRRKRVSYDDYQVAAMYNKHLDCFDGKGVPQDDEKSFLLLQQAADAGYADAILGMGWHYLNGVGVEKDIEEAKVWYKKSARMREPKAMFSLGQTAYDEKSWSDAKIWFKRASDLGHHRSLYWLGKLYWRGRGVELDQRKGKALWQEAADRKVDEAQRTIRMLFSRSASKK